MNTCSGGAVLTDGPCYLCGRTREQNCPVDAERDAEMRANYDRLRAENERLRKALEGMVREFGFDVVHPQGLVHDECEAIHAAQAALRGEGDGNANP